MNYYNNDKNQGFLLVKFQSFKQLNNFMKKEYFYQGRQLEIKNVTKDIVFLNNDSSFSEMMEFFRRPCKVLITSIPKSMSKHKVKEILSEFGEIEEHAYVSDNISSYNYSFVIFVLHESARKCVEKQKIPTNCKNFLNVFYAKYEISKSLLKKIEPPSIKNYIKSLSQKNNQLDPIKFNQ